MIQYLLAAVIFVVLDGTYLNLIRNYFTNQIKSIQGTGIELKIIPTAITYIFLIFGLCYFIIRKHKSIQDAAFLGLVIYGVYEFTNYSMFKNWSIGTVIIDTTWGTILFALTTFLVYKIKDVF